MIPLDVESPPGTGLFSITNVFSDFQEMPDPGAANWAAVITTPPKHVQTDQDLEIYFQWQQNGLLSGLPLPLKYEMEVFLEQMGPAEAASSYKTTKNYTPGVGHVYNEKVVVNGAQPGICRIVAVFRVAFTGGGVTDTPIVGFHDFGLINFYKAD